MQKCWKRLNHSAKIKVCLKVSEEFIPICLCVKLNYHSSQYHYTTCEIRQSVKLSKLVANRMN